MRNFWEKLVRALQLIFYVYFLFLGFIGKAYDITNYRVLKSKALTIYVICSNVAVICLMPYVLHHTGVFMDWASGHSNDLLRTTDLANTIVTFGGAIITIIKRRLSEGSIERVMLEFFSLRKEYFDRLIVPAALENRHVCQYLLQASLSLSQLVITIHTLLIMSPSIDVRTVFLAFYMSNICFIMHGVTYYMFFSLWNTLMGYELLNLELLKLRKRLQLQVKSPTWQQLMQLAADELSLIARIHWRSTDTVQRLHDAFTGQIITVTVALMLDSITFGYYSVLVFNHTLKLSLTFGTIFGFVTSYSLPLINLFYLYWMCEKTMCAFRNTADILKTFQTLPKCHAVFEHQCETFAMQMVQRPLYIQVAGMCKLNIAAFLSLAGYIFRHIIIMLQFDLSNRYHRLS